MIGPGKRPKRRDARRSVASDVSETFAAMANADGGTMHGDRK